MRGDARGSGIWMVRRRSPGRLASGALRQMLMLVMAVAVAYPVYYMVSTSLKTQSSWTLDQFGLPLNATLENYATVVADGRVPIWFLNTVIVTGASVGLTALISTLAAFAIARIRFRGRVAILRLMLVLMVVPPAVLVIPLFVGLQPLGLSNSHLGLVLVYTGMLIPFSVYMLSAFFRALPTEVFDAALLDGATTMRILRSIVVPLSAPGLVTLIVVNSLWVWNELLLALVFLQDDRKRTLMPGLTLFKGHYTINEPLVMAATFLAVVPMLALFMFGQRYFVRGLVAGAVK